MPGSPGGSACALVLLAVCAASILVEGGRRSLEASSEDGTGAGCSTDVLALPAVGEGSLSMLQRSMEKPIAPAAATREATALLMERSPLKASHAGRRHQVTDATAGAQSLGPGATTENMLVGNRTLQSSRLSLSSGEAVTLANMSASGDRVTLQGDQAITAIALHQKPNMSLAQAGTNVKVRRPTKKKANRDRKAGAKVSHVKQARKVRNSLLSHGKGKVKGEADEEGLKLISEEKVKWGQMLLFGGSVLLPFIFLTFGSPIGGAQGIAASVGKQQHGKYWGEADVGTT